MKKLRRKILSIILSVALVTSFVPSQTLMTAVAAGSIASVTESTGTVTNYDNMETAITAALGKSGSTVTLLQDISTSVSLIDIAGTFELDLNGHIWDSTLSLDVGNEPGSLKVIIKNEGRLNYLSLGKRALAKLSGGTYYKICYSGVIGSGKITGLLQDNYAFKDSSGKIRFPSDIENSSGEIQYVTVCKQPVSATVGENTTYYNNLREARDGCFITGATLTLVDNINIVDENECNLFFDTKTWTLDFNGKTVTGLCDISLKTATLTLKDSSGNNSGGITTTKERTGIITIEDAGTLNVEGGSYTNTNGIVIDVRPSNGSKKEYDASVNISGGVFDSGTAVGGCYTICLDLLTGAGQKTISGGVVKGTGIYIHDMQVNFMGGKFSRILRTVQPQQSLCNNLHNIETLTIDGRRCNVKSYCYKYSDGKKH